MLGTTIGFLSLRGGISGNVEELEELMERFELSYFIFVDVGLIRGAATPIRGVVAEVRGEKEMAVVDVGAPTGRRAQYGVMVIRRGQGATETVHRMDPKGRWLVVELGDVVVLAAYLAPSLPPPQLEEFDETKQWCLDQFPGRTVICVGDFNARVGNIVGDHGVSEANRREWS